MNLWKTYKQTSLVIKMSIGFLLGIIIGVIVGPSIEVIKPLGTILINLLSMIAIPVVFLTVVLAVNNMNPKELGKTGGKLVLYYSITTAMAVLIGLGLALIINPGANLTLPNAQVDEPANPSFSDILLNIVPDNIFAAFNSGNLMAILFLAIIIGYALSTMKHANDPKLVKYGTVLQEVLEALNELFFRVLKGILLYAPIGIFAIAASTFGTQGWDTFESLLKFTAVFYLGVILLWAFVYTGFLKFSRVSIRKFYTTIRRSFTTAFFTSSSVATLPIAMEDAKKLGVSDKIVHFSLPLGAIFNSDGGALRMGASIVFAANVTNANFSATDLAMIVVIGTLLSIGTAGVPAAGLVTLAAVLTLFDLPLEIVALIAGIDALIGMAGTASNVVGDIVGAVVVDKKGKKA